MAANSHFGFRQGNSNLSAKFLRLFLCLNLSLTLLGLMIPPIEVEAATIVVNTTDDELNNDGDCSLREAIYAANSNYANDACPAGTSGMDTITLPAGTYVLSISGSEEAANSTGDLNVIDDLTINGVSMYTTIIEGDTDWEDRIMSVSNADLILRDLSLRNGNTNNQGGGLFHSGNDLVLDRVRIYENQALDLGGGGLFIDTSTSTSIDSSYIYDNSCPDPDCDGGGIFMWGPVYMNLTQIYNNSAQGNGGGIYNGSDGVALMIFDSRITSNQAALGAGMYTTALTMGESEVSGNSAFAAPTSAGGGIYYNGTGTINIANSTISTNQAQTTGGGLWLGGSGDVVLNNATITANKADAPATGGDYGGGVYFNASPSGVYVANSIIAQNLMADVVDADHANCTNDGGTLITFGYNLQSLRSSTMGCDFNGTNDMQGTSAAIDALLGPLQDNGGPTYTHALLTDSPAIEGGNTGTPSGYPYCEANDQRGVSRPQDTYCDIGAFELTPNIPPFVPNNPTPADSAVDVSTYSNLSWDGGDPDGDAVTYDVYIDADDPTPESLECNNATSTTCDLASLSLDTTYYWYVDADDGQATTRGPTWSFTTSDTLPGDLLIYPTLEVVVPDRWKGYGLDPVDGSDCSIAHGGSCSAALTGTPEQTKMLFYGLPGFSGSAGDTFDLSYYNKRDSVGGAGAVQVRVSMRYTDATMGHFSYVPGVGTADWALYSHDFTAAKDYDWGVVRLIFSKPNGTLWYDDMSLMRNGSEELLDNSDMELRVPAGWKGSFITTADGSDCTFAYEGSCSAVLTHSTGGETKMLYLGLPGFSGSAGDAFRLCYWNMRDSVGGAGAVQVRVSIRYTDATMGHFSFVPGVGTAADWEFFQHEFTAAKDYDWGVIRLIFSKPNGTLWYDAFNLYRWVP